MRATTLLYALSLAWGLAAQNCTNYGSPNGSGGCDCPAGFGGSTCAAPACGGTLFQGASRPYVSNSDQNATEAGCSCENGWGGNGCNVCQTANACQSAFNAAGGTVSQAGWADSQNETIVCNTAPRVYSSGQMSCHVINPTLQSQYPGITDLNIMRSLTPDLAPLANVTAFGAAGTLYSQLMYNGVEQFYCAGSGCNQTVDTAGVTKYTCPTVNCTCIPDRTFCGGPGGTVNIAPLIDTLVGPLVVSCDQAAANGSAPCSFEQTLLNELFGQGGLALSGCTFGECLQQNVIDNASNSTTSDSTHAELSSGVIAGIAVVGALALLALAFSAWGCLAQRRARRRGAGDKTGDPASGGGVGVEWTDVSYVIPSGRRRRAGFTDDKTVLDAVYGHVRPGEMMAVLGPSGAGKTTLVEILAGRALHGRVTGAIAFSAGAAGAQRARVGFVPQDDVLAPELTVREALMFAARLRLPEHVSDADKRLRVEAVLEQLGLTPIADVRMGGTERRGISGGERRRVSIGLELVASPDVLLLDEPTSGLDSVSAAKVIAVLHDLAHNPARPTAVIASIHQPNSRLYQTFDQVVLLSHGRTLYAGPGAMAPATHFGEHGLTCPEGYNVADFLLEVASDPPVTLLNATPRSTGNQLAEAPVTTSTRPATEEAEGTGSADTKVVDELEMTRLENGVKPALAPRVAKGYVTTSLTQLEVLAGREWKILRRDKSLFFTHVASAVILGVIVGGMYFKTGITIAGFQSRVGCLFFLGSLIAFSSLSALYNIVEIRPLFLRERSNAYYSPAMWLLSRIIFDVVPLRVMPTILVATITYWMAGLAPTAAHFFKFLLVLVLYTLAMTLYNFLLACVFRNGGIAILLSALSALFQMTFAGFFVHLTSIPPVLRWLQWICPLKYTLEALSVNEVGSGLQIQDTLEGVPVNVSAGLIMKLLFGFGDNNYYRDVLVLVAFILGFGVAVIAVVWRFVRERR